MKWRRLGRVFEPRPRFDWMASHAAYPLALHLGDDLFRVYFATRDASSRGHAAFLELDLTEPSRILRLSPVPVLGPGELGAFDDSGVSLGSLVEVNGVLHLYYLGWNLGVTVRWRNSIGLAVAEGTEETFRRYSRAPVLDRHGEDPFSLSYPWVLEEDGLWRMWYGADLCGARDGGGMRHVIKYAESRDGVHWERPGTVCIALEGPGERAVTRPCVVRDGQSYKMWYSTLRERYRIGYAESADGILWRRLDHLVGIDVAPGGWDSESLEYPCVFDHAGERYLLYNGNQFGGTGFGLAVLEEG